MSEFKRKQSCKTCGGVIFELKQGCGYVEYNCKECGKYIGEINFEPYETLNPKCGNCKNDTFKILIQVNGNEQRYYGTICSKCEESATKEYRDIDGNYIDDITRDVLIKDDIIVDLQRELNEKKEKLESYADEVQELRYELNDKEEDICSLKCEVKHKDDEISSLKSEVESLESEVSNLQYEVSDLEDKLRD